MFAIETACDGLVGCTLLMPLLVVVIVNVVTQTEGRSYQDLGILLKTDSYCLYWYIRAIGGLKQKLGSERFKKR